jgi:hypothetical protein
VINRCSSPKIWFKAKHAAAESSIVLSSYVRGAAYAEMSFASHPSPSLVVTNSRSQTPHLVGSRILAKGLWTKVSGRNWRDMLPIPTGFVAQMALQQPRWSTGKPTA